MKTKWRSGVKCENTGSAFPERIEFRTLTPLYPSLSLASSYIAFALAQCDRMRQRYKYSARVG